MYVCMCVCPVRVWHDRGLQCVMINVVRLLHPERDTHHPNLTSNRLCKDIKHGQRLTRPDEGKVTKQRERMKHVTRTPCYERRDEGPHAVPLPRFPPHRSDSAGESVCAQPPCEHRPAAARHFEPKVQTSTSFCAGHNSHPPAAGKNDWQQR